MKRVLLTIMKVWLEFDSVEEREAYKEEHKHKNWNFVEEYEREDGCVLVVERLYKEDEDK